MKSHNRITLMGGLLIGSLAVGSININANVKIILGSEIDEGLRQNYPNAKIRKPKNQRTEQPKNRCSNIQN